MKKRDLFVFAGQSNMMGAAVLPPKVVISASDCYEYKHKPKRMGEAHGSFVAAGYPCGEFSYTKEAMKVAYLAENTDRNGKSTLAEYSKNTYFCPAMSNQKNAATHEQYAFDFFSESTMQKGATLAPLFAMEWAGKGQCCAYAHIAKGGVSINHYFNAHMTERYNEAAQVRRQEGAKVLLLEKNTMCEEASAYFDQKVGDFFADAKAQFPDEDQSVKAFVWCQGETNVKGGFESYLMRLEVLWEHLRELGFTHFFCVRLGFWGGENNPVHEIMRAQEQFCRENDGCYMVTRAMSLMPHPALENVPDWFAEKPTAEYENCRDCYFGYSNHHINEKGFALIGKRMAANVFRILREGKEPLLEKENVARLMR